MRKRAGASCCLLSSGLSEQAYWTERLWQSKSNGNQEKLENHCNIWLQVRAVADEKQWKLVNTQKSLTKQAI